MSDQPDDIPPAPAQPPAVLAPDLWKPGSATRAALLAALQRGDSPGALRLFLGDEAEQLGVYTPRVKALMDYVIALRRQDVAVVGNHEAFVRKTESGSLHQVVAPVRLSLRDGTLYQIPKRGKFVLGTDTFWQWPRNKDDKYEWRDYLEHPHQAKVSHEGYLRMNAVCGCSIKQPPTVIVDGRSRENPYVERDGFGDLLRIVCQVNVSGPAPLTGNVVVVQYVLDLDPRSDLRHMLAGIAKGKPTDDDNDESAKPTPKESKISAVRLVHRDAWVADLALMQPEERGRWHWLPLYGGVGYAHELTNPAVGRSYEKFIQLLEYSFRKAQTVARRNAMKAHPALAVQTVVIDDRGEALVRCVGWSGSPGDLERYSRALDTLAQGTRTPGMDVIDMVETYQPENHETGEAEIDTRAPEEHTTGIWEADRAQDAANELRAALDEVVLELSPSAVSRIGYPPPPEVTVEGLQQMLTAAQNAR
jgi:hypothetical protein